MLYGICLSFFVLFLNWSYSYVSYDMKNEISATSINYRTGDCYVSSLVRDPQIRNVCSVGKFSPTINSTALTFKPLFDNNFDNIDTRYMTVLTSDLDNPHVVFASINQEGGSRFPTLNFKIAGEDLWQQIYFDGRNGDNFLEGVLDAEDVTIIAITGSSPDVMTAARNATETKMGTCAVTFFKDNNGLSRQFTHALTKYDFMNTDLFCGSDMSTIEGEGYISTAWSNDVILHYDKYLGKLYFAPKSIQFQYVHPSLPEGQLNFSMQGIQVFDASGDSLNLFDNAGALDNNGWNKLSSNSNITGLRVSSEDSTEIRKIYTLYIHNLDTMKTSSGKHYLIVHGGVGSVEDNKFDKIYSLPLVGPGDHASTPGTLAHISDDGTVDFNTTALAGSNLYTDQNAPRVGGGTTPWASTARVSLRVIGDTVYAIVDDNTNDHTKLASGVYFSRANLKEDGSRIINWSVWARAISIKRGPGKNDADDGRMSFAEIDIRTGRVWAVDALKKFVTLSSWSKTITPAGRSMLQGQSNYRHKVTRAVQDFTDANTNAFVPHTTTNTLNIFVRDAGGVSTQFTVQGGTLPSGREGVVIMRQTADDLAGVPTENNFKILELPQGTSKILSVGYTNWSSNVDEPIGVLLAGTQQGIYAFLEDVNGVLVGGYPITSNNGNANMHDLAAGHWANGAWHRVFQNTVVGNVTHILSNGNACYLLDRQVQTDKVLNNVYRITRQPILNNSFETWNLDLLLTGLTENNDISATTDLPNIYVLHIIPSENDATTEQLILGTSNGAHLTAVTGGIQNVPPNTTVPKIPITQTNGYVVVAFDYSNNTLSIISHSPARPTTNETRPIIRTNIPLTFGNDNTPTTGQATVDHLSPSEVNQIIMILTPPSEYQNNGDNGLIYHYWNDEIFQKNIGSTGSWTDGARAISYYNYTSSEGEGLHSDVYGFRSGSQFHELINSGQDINISRNVLESENEIALYDLTFLDSPTLNDNGVLTMSSEYHLSSLD